MPWWKLNGLCGNRLVVSSSLTFGTINLWVAGSNPARGTIHPLVLKIYEPFEIEGISKRVDEGRYLGKDRIAQGPYPCQID